jgi:hypothetical protein
MSFSIIACSCLCAHAEWWRWAVVVIGHRARDANGSWRSGVSRRDSGTSVSTYDAVRKLRPGFFVNGRTAGSGRAPAEPSAVLERGFPEPLDVLKLVPPDLVAEIRFVEPREATVTYGPAYTGGVIVVRLKGGI